MGEVRACRGCGAGFGPAVFDRILDLGYQPLAENDDGKGYPLDLIQCRQCGLVQLGYSVSREAVFRDDHPYLTGSTRALREHFGALAAEVAPMLGHGSLIIDIGANDGTFLEAVRRRAPGARVLAIEPTGAAKECRARTIPVEREFWSAALADRIAGSLGRATVVTASNVMAHVSDVHGFLAGVERVLAERGILVAENHDFASVVNGLQIDTVYHEHEMYYTPATFGALLERHGFLTSRIDRIDTHGGSFRTWAARRKPDLQARADTARDQLCRLLEIACEEGPVYGIGAATRATPLIHWADADRWVHKVCEVPGHPKIGTTVPGTEMEIVDEAELIRDQPPYALLFCWHVAADVVPKLRAAGYEGKFIVPLPQARIWNG
jgi:C-methyltransferase C-terminal domain/Putative zinc binding domain/Methyltransferase domain